MFRQQITTTSKTRHTPSRLLPALLACALLTAAPAAEFRELVPILVPAALPDGASAVTVIRPVSPRIVEAAIRELTASWNTPLLRDHLSDRFYDRQRLLDVIDSFAARDARIDILGIQGSQTLQQHVEIIDGVSTLVSRVSVTVITQVSFTDPSRGFQALSGTNTYVLNVRQQVQP